MRRFFGEKQGEDIVLVGDEYNHFKNVLRMGVGDEILVSLGDMYEYACEAIDMSNKQVLCKVNGRRVCQGNPQKNLVLFQAITKKEKFEFIVQKATEIGISRVVPFVSEHVIAKVTDNKIDRLNAIARGACKQCERTIMPVIDNVKTIDEVIDEFKNFEIVLFANERALEGEKPRKIATLTNIGIIVGSEGGFSSDEKNKFIAAGATSISLGRRILRAETASVAMMSLTSILSGN